MRGGGVFFVINAYISSYKILLRERTTNHPYTDRYKTEHNNIYFCFHLNKGEKEMGKNGGINGFVYPDMIVHLPFVTLISCRVYGQMPNTMGACIKCLLLVYSNSTPHSNVICIYIYFRAFIANSTMMKGKQWENLDNIIKFIRHTVSTTENYYLFCTVANTHTHTPYTYRETLKVREGQTMRVPSRE